MNEAEKYKGLRNQGTTDYLNCILQLLFHLPSLRNSILLIPSHGKDAQRFIPLALQRVFLQLAATDSGENGDSEDKEKRIKSAVDTKELTQSFGWSQSDAYVSHDIMEMEGLLLDVLQQAMKDTVVSGAIENLLETKIKNFIKCVDVPYESSRIENTNFIMLEVKDCGDVRQSFLQFVQHDILEGDNRFKVEGHGLQVAKKGCIFVSLPPVLHLHLRRSEYDFEHDKLVKIDSSYTMPDIIDLSEFVESDSDKSHIYYLHAVVVHVGIPNFGQHYVLIRPPPSPSPSPSSSSSSSSSSDYPFPSRWINFNDNYVSTVAALDDQHCRNAVMLVYIRSSDVANIFHP